MLQYIEWGVHFYFEATLYLDSTTVRSNLYCSSSPRLQALPRNHFNSVWGLPEYISKRSLAHTKIYRAAAFCYWLIMATIAEHANVLFRFLVLFMAFQPEDAFAGNACVLYGTVYVSEWSLYMDAFASQSTVKLQPSSGTLELCPGSPVTLVCTINVMQASVLYWRVTENNNPIWKSKYFTNASNTDVEYTIGSFTVTLVSRNPLISTATLTNKFDYQHNGTEVTCKSTLSPTPSPASVASAVITLKGTCAGIMHACEWQVWYT